MPAADQPPRNPLPAPPGFLPTCPSCKYDLSNLPDGPCPGCGVHFTHEGLIAAALDKERLGANNSLLAIAIFITVLKFTCVPLSEVPPVLRLIPDALVCVLAFGWIGQNKNELAGARSLLLLWLLIPTAGIGAGYGRSILAFVAVPGSVGLAILIDYHAMHRSAVLSLLTVGTITAATLLITGVSLTAYGVANRRAGYYWSELDRPWPRATLHPAYAYAMSSPEIIAYGLSATAVALIAAPFLHKGWRRERRAREAP